MGKKSNKNNIKLSHDDTEKIINMIQKHEVLYNPKIDEHHDRVLLENIYEKIAMDMKIEGLSGMCHNFLLSIQRLMLISTL